MRIARKGFLRGSLSLLVIERREFSQGGSLGADWVMPFGRSPHPFSREELRKTIGKPQFRDGAELEVVNVAVRPISSLGTKGGAIARELMIQKGCVKYLPDEAS